MLCEIATDPENDLSSNSTFDLYDSFIHYLIDREVQKPGRYPNFTGHIRRAFNAAVAWWLWERGNASTTTLGDVPVGMCTSAVGDTFHDFDDVGLKRELTTGCLVEKGGQTIYFGHRSLQEFLVAEHLYVERLLEDPDTHRSSIGKIWPLLTSVISDFILQWLRRESDAGQKLAMSWLAHLEPVVNVEPNLAALEFFANLMDVAELSVEDRVSTPWRVFLRRFSP
jgi:hypothetical protein